MKASTVDEVKREFREVKGEANKESRKATNDPLWKVKMKSKSGESKGKPATRKKPADLQG